MTVYEFLQYLIDSLRKIELFAKIKKSAECLLENITKLIIIILSLKVNRAKSNVDGLW